MNQYYFSPSSNAFYADNGIRYGAPFGQKGCTIPADSIAVTDADFAAYSQPAPSGKKRGLNSSGALAWVAAMLTLQDAKNSKISDLYTDGQAQILGGFQSSALGSAYTYPSQLVDQQNLAASVLDSLVAGTAAGWTTDFWCADNSTPPVWARRAHTAAQIQQVGKDCKAFISAAQTKLDGLVQQVNAAGDQATVDAIAW